MEKIEKSKKVEILFNFVQKNEIKNIKDIFEKSNKNILQKDLFLRKKKIKKIHHYGNNM